MIKPLRFPALQSRLRYFFLLPLLICLYGCPFSSSYKLDADPAEYADDQLVGNWATMVTTASGKEGPVKMSVRKKNDMEYSIDFTGDIYDMKPFGIVTQDSIKCNAYISNASGFRFLNISIQGQIYIAEFILKDNRLSVLPLAEKFTAKLIRSDSDLRNAVEFHFKTRVKPVYDEPFCLREMVRVN